jgi:hypothetical protein
VSINKCLKMHAAQLLAVGCAAHAHACHVMNTTDCMPASLLRSLCSPLLRHLAATCQALY